MEESRRMYKQVIVFNSDILRKVGKGKLAAQVAHASLGALREAERIRPGLVRAWERRGAKKVVVKAPKDVLIERYEIAKLRGLPCYLVRDAGHTQLPPGTITALGIGPAPEKRVDQITGDLKLL